MCIFLHVYISIYVYSYIPCCLLVYKPIHHSKNHSPGIGKCPVRGISLKLQEEDDGPPQRAASTGRHPRNWWFPEEKKHRMVDVNYEL